MPSEQLNWPALRMGDGNIPLVFLHGFLGRKEDWLPIISELSLKYDCIALDLPGHGEHINGADIPDDKQVVASLEEQRVRMGVDRWHVVGYSMGGRLALHYALNTQSAVSSLSLISSSPGIDDGIEREKRRKIDQIWIEFIKQSSADDFIAAWYAQPIFHSLERRPELLHQLKELRGSMDLSAMPDVLRKWGQGMMPSTWNKLKSLTMPMQFITGRLDNYYCQIAGRVKNLLPATRIVIVEQAGHPVHLERPVQIAAAVDNFISRGE